MANVSKPSDTPQQIRRWTLFALWMAVLAFGVFFIRRDVFGKHFGNTDLPFGVTANYAMIVHITTMTLAFFVAPIQFSDRFRRRWPQWHRRAGWTYVAMSALSVPAVYWLGYFSFCPTCAPPFFLWSTVWTFMTTMAVIMAVRRDFTAHKQFMIRSYVLMLGFVFTRIDEFIPFPFPDGPGIDRKPMIIWSVWVVPLLVTELFLTWIPLARGKKRKQARVFKKAEQPPRQP